MGKSDFSVKEDDGTTRLMLVRRINKCAHHIYILAIMARGKDITNRPAFVERPPYPHPIRRDAMNTSFGKTMPD